MTDRFMRLPEVEQCTSLSRWTIRRRMADGTFPQSVALGANSVAWRESEIDAWMQNPSEWRRAA
jgi:prophage regulatory protein